MGSPAHPRGSIKTHIKCVDSHVKSFKGPHCACQRGRNVELARGLQASPPSITAIPAPREGETSGERVPLVGSVETAAPSFRPAGDNAEGTQHRPQEPLTHAERTRGQFGKEELPWAGSCSQRQRKADAGEGAGRDGLWPNRHCSTPGRPRAARPFTATAWGREEGSSRQAGQRAPPWGGGGGGVGGDPEARASQPAAEGKAPRKLRRATRPCGDRVRRWPRAGLGQNGQRGGEGRECSWGLRRVGETLGGKQRTSPAPLPGLWKPMIRLMRCSEFMRSFLRRSSARRWEADRPAPTGAPGLSPLSVAAVTGSIFLTTIWGVATVVLAASAAEPKTSDLAAGCVAPPQRRPAPAPPCRLRNKLARRRLAPEEAGAAILSKGRGGGVPQLVPLG